MRRKRDADDPALGLDHDPEDALEDGMSAEGAEVDRAETLASTGDAKGSFREIASGSATGVGIDRVEPEVQPIRDGWAPARSRSTRVRHRRERRRRLLPQDYPDDLVCRRRSRERPAP
jgi:hypothetical protein